MDLQNREKSGPFSARGKMAAIAVVGVGLLLLAAAVGGASAGDGGAYDDSPGYQSRPAAYVGNSPYKVVDNGHGTAPMYENHADDQQMSPAEVEGYEDDDYLDVHAGSGTDVWVNGVELTWDEVYAVEVQIGVTVLSGDYWSDEMGNYGYAGSPAMGNLFNPQSAYGAGQSGGWSSGGMDSTMFGNVGGGNFYDSSTGCSYMPGSGVSC